MGSVEKGRSMKGRKGTSKLPRRVSEMSKEALEATLRKKKDCNVRALQIVERLLENTVSEDWFLDSLKFISESHFQDIIEERAITMNCGYPLCPKKLKNIPNQQYHISTKLNKVYDITERKNFCSNQCYKASTYLKRQLLTSPLWLRDKEEIPKFKLFPLHSTSGGIGEEVYIGQSSPLKEELKQLHKEEKSDNFTSVSQFMKDSLSEIESEVNETDKRETTRKGSAKQKHKNNESKSGVKEDEKEIETKQSSLDSRTSSNGKENKEQERHCDPSIAVELTDVQSEANDICITVENETSKKLDNVSICQPHDKHMQTDHKAKEKHHMDEFRKMTDLNECFKETVIINCTSVEAESKKNTEPASSESQAVDTQNECSSKPSTSAPQKSKETKCKKNGHSKNKGSKKQSLDVPPMTSAVIHIEQCLYEWFTLESMCYLFGEEKMREMVSEKGESIKEYYKAVSCASWDPKFKEQYMAICKRLNIMELEENEFDKNCQVATKPLPDYMMVKEEGKKMELKVSAFFQGKTAYEENVGVKSQDSKDDGDVPVLPLVDLHAQNALRRRIVLDRLNRVLPDLLRTFDLSSRDITGEVRSLVTTFSLGAHNITFRPPEWSLLGLIIIKMLSIKDTRLRILLDTEQVRKYTTMMLIGFQQDGAYLDRLMAWLTDLDHLIQKQKVK